MNKQIQASIKGISPLLMHRFAMEPIEALEKKRPDEQAEYAAYRMPDKTLYIPGIALQRALVAGATFSKGKGRATLQKQVAACVIVAPEYLSLGTDKYEVDARPVVIAATKGRVMRYRPRLDTWGVTFTIDYDDALLNERSMRQVVDDTGQRVGLLEFRPANKGSYGRFVVVNWKA